MAINHICEHKGCFSREVHPYGIPGTSDRNGSLLRTYRCLKHAREDGFSAPAFPASDILHASPSAYLNWLVEQLPDLKFGAHEGDPVAEILWNVIRELRSQDERLRGIEKALQNMEGD